MGLFGPKKTKDGGLEFGGHGGFVIKNIEGYERFTWQVYLIDDQIRIKCKTKKMQDTEMILKVSNIIDIQYSNDIETFTQSKSSLTKGLVGGALFGVPGAIVGSAPKTKTEVDTTGNLLITYKSSSGEEKNLLLRDNFSNRNEASSLYRALKEKMPKKEPPTGRIEL
ncbi:MAG: hypothetical protein LKJ75_02570 [Clostridia bacterium]|jgi:hypothetical protein|nr:hypothetical protein [Clostridia bacterium]MCI2014068.1 hypothetical protein [Clostridia bacterium]